MYGYFDFYNDLFKFSFFDLNRDCKIIRKFLYLLFNYFNYIFGRIVSFFFEGVDLKICDGGKLMVWIFYRILEFLVLLELVD